jgi:hypothetical protein
MYVGHILLHLGLHCGSLVNTCCWRHTRTNECGAHSLGLSGSSSKVSQQSLGVQLLV